MRIPPGGRPERRARARRRRPRRAARARRRRRCESRSSADVTSSAAPTAWTQRAPTSTSNEGASPHASDAAANTRTPATNASRGRRRETYAAGTATTASTRLNDVSTHATDVIATSNSPEDLRQRERDDRGVREREPDADREQPAALARVGTRLLHRLAEACGEHLDQRHRCARIRLERREQALARDGDRAHRTDRVDVGNPAAARDRAPRSRRSARRRPSVSRATRAARRAPYPSTHEQELAARLADRA